jgi:hypothetical protein
VQAYFLIGYFVFIERLEGPDFHFQSCGATAYRMKYSSPYTSASSISLFLLIDYNKKAIKFSEMPPDPVKMLNGISKKFVNASKKADGPFKIIADMSETVAGTSKPSPIGFKP